MYSTYEALGFTGSKRQSIRNAEILEATQKAGFELIKTRLDNERDRVLVLSKVLKDVEGFGDKCYATHEYGSPDGKGFLFWGHYNMTIEQAHDDLQKR
ncbi:MAG: hypothetical protein CBE16_00045 [Rhodospirillaceae bacterium TMED256]|nr:MAG: hypothetical protein CBE16_00045 [Rhodospirillaceae bacterium TMED256]|tara:strand:+ start:113 stop:406 length:294 start_codon:yes stop_codon:yes gene_type:complete